MGKLTKSGIGSFLFGFCGNLGIEVFPMTGWEIPQGIARLVVFVLSGFVLTVNKAVVLDATLTAIEKEE
jgi:hypothetical protein